MSDLEIRRVYAVSEEVLREGGRAVGQPVKRVAVAAVITNPFAGQIVDELDLLIGFGEELGDLLTGRAVALLDQIMRHIMPDQEIDKASSTAGKEHFMPQIGLLTSNVHRNIHDAIADFIAMVSQMKNPHLTYPKDPIFSLILFFSRPICGSGSCHRQGLMALVALYRSPATPPHIEYPRCHGFSAAQ